MKSNSMLTLLLMLLMSLFGLRGFDLSSIFSGPINNSPYPPPAPGINVTRQEYDAALAKWQAAGIEEYEIVVSYSQVYSNRSGTWTLRVKGGDIEVINRLRDGVPTTPEPDMSGDMLKFLTVDAMFARIMGVLGDPNQGKITIGDNSYETEYKVTFDSTLGYPQLFAVYPIYITDNDSYTRVQSLKILAKR